MRKFQTDPLSAYHYVSTRVWKHSVFPTFEAAKEQVIHLLREEVKRCQEEVSFLQASISKMRKLEEGKEYV